MIFIFKDSSHKLIAFLLCDAEILSRLQTAVCLVIIIILIF